MKHFLRVLLIGLLTSLFFSSCATFDSAQHNDDEAWITLFDGSSLDGWRGYNADRLPPGWAIEGHELTYSKERAAQDTSGYKGTRDIIYAAQEFENFELYLEWKIPPGGNSGILYHAVEGYKRIYQTAPEYQLLDDAGFEAIHDTILKPEQLTGADYAMYAPDVLKKKLNPVGEWNSSRIVFTPERVEHWLNGQLLLSFVPWSEDWQQRKANSKWKDTKSYGKYKKGFIGLQDHGSALWFRNIKVRPLLIEHTTARDYWPLPGDSVGPRDPGCSDGKARGNHRYKSIDPHGNLRVD